MRTKKRRRRKMGNRAFKKALSGLVSSRQKKLETSLLKAMNGANKRGYTGNFGSKGSLFDDPTVKRAKANYDRFLKTV